MTLPQERCEASAAFAPVNNMPQSPALAAADRLGMPPRSVATALPALQATMTLGLRVRVRVCAAGHAAQMAAGLVAFYLVAAAPPPLPLLVRSLLRLAGGSEAAAHPGAAMGTRPGAATALADCVTTMLAFGILLPLAVVFRLEQTARARFLQAAHAR